MAAKYASRTSYRFGDVASKTPVLPSNKSVI